MSILRDICLALACTSILYYFLAAIAGLLFTRRAAKTPVLPDAPSAVAVLKPLHGADENLVENLESFLSLDYPNKEFIFGVTTPDDPAIQAIDEMRRRHPEARITQTVGDEPSTNRKVGKLLRMLRHPPHAEILVMSDADVAVERDYLRRLVSELHSQSDAGLSTCLYRGLATPGSLGARLEALYINTDFAPTAFLSYYLEPTCYAFASTIAIRQNTLREVGGLESVKNSFGDDFALAQRVMAAGYRIILSSSIVTMVTERSSFADFWARQMRWARVDRKIRPVSLARLAINGPFWALALVLASGCTHASIGVAALVFAARWGMAAWTLQKILRVPLAFTDLLLTPVKDLIMQAVWFGSLFGNHVEWRGRKLRLLPTGEMEEQAE